jgi:hypothetical protein
MNRRFGSIGSGRFNRFGSVQSVWFGSIGSVRFNRFGSVQFEPNR